jgi:hypothetical protein
MTTTRPAGHNETVRRLGAWVVAVPVMVAGTEIAHTLAYRIVYPQADVRWHVLAASGHGYTARAPLALGLGFALVVIGLVSLVVDAARRRPTTDVAPWAFALLPLLSFTAQEFLERWVALGSVPWWMVEQPTFRIGLALQLPFALAAYLAARLLLRAGRAIGEAVARRLRRQAGGRMPARHLPAVACVVPRAPFAAGRSVRGPPPVVA